MALTAQEHRACAQDNEAFYNAIGGAQSQWPGWAVTALFYVALHEVRAFFADYGVTVKDHEGVRIVFRKNRPRLTKLARHYRRLSQFSVDARYENVSHGAADFTRAEASLREIRQEISRLSAQGQPLTGP